MVAAFLVFKEVDALPRGRRSLVMRRTRDTSNLLVKMRRKQKLEHDRKQDQVRQTLTMEEGRLVASEKTEPHKTDDSCTIRN